MICGTGTVLSSNYSIPSLVERIYPIEQKILIMAQNLGFDEDACFRLRLAMDEAMVNAIIHGNLHDRAKKVYVEARGRPRAFEVTIRDEGHGFDVDSLKDPTADENLHATHGRGVFLIRQFMSDVFFNEMGNQITFVLRR